MTSAASEKGRVAAHFAILLVIVVVYLALASATVFTKAPYSDEAWFASPAFNLVTEGHMGTTVREVVGTPWTRMDQRTYWQPPLHFLVQAGWYLIFGFSLFTQRYLSVLWGLVALASTYVLVHSLTRNRTSALLAIGLLAVDFVFVDRVADGRMDILSAALAISGFALYVSLRDKNLSLAMLVGHGLVVASGLTHPNGVLALAGLVLLNVVWDRRRIRAKHVLIGLLPYVVGAVGWGLYISQDVEAFIDQFRQNLSGRVLSSASVVDSLRLEITQRYFVTYGWAEGGSGMARLKIVVLLAYWIGVIGCLCSAVKRKDSATGGLLTVFALYFVVMAVLFHNKTSWYLVHILPFYVALLAIWVSSEWSRSRTTRAVAVCAVIAFCVLQVGVTARHAMRNEYRNIDRPAIEQLLKLDDGTNVVLGTAELAYALGFDRGPIDDVTLGYFSGRKPDVVVMTSRYWDWFERFERRAPEIHRHVTSLMENELEVMFKNEKYEIYVRK